MAELQGWRNCIVACLQFAQSYQEAYWETVFIEMLWKDMKHALF